MIDQPGLIVLFGSGETSPNGRKVFDWVLEQLAPPINIAVLETPAGFQPNSERVAEDVADFIRVHLQNHRPAIRVIPARKRGTPFSPDNPDVVEPIAAANAIFLGPGSPTYAVRQLRDSLAWEMLQYRHRQGAALILASAATIAASRYALPVYEIYKVGEDLHWQPGLDLFGPYGLSPVFVPHWNNTEGGAELDTGRCFMGQARFAEWKAGLPADATIIGIDEHSALVVDPGAGICRVMGKGGVTRWCGDDECYFSSGETFPIAELGPFRMPRPEAGIRVESIARLEAADEVTETEAAPDPPSDVAALAGERQAARGRHDWVTADALRDRIAALGWRVIDTAEGPRLEPLNGTPKQRNGVRH